MGVAAALRWRSPALVDPVWRFDWRVGLLFGLAAFAASYPGRLNGDSLFSLLTAGSYNNWHSATLVWLWSLPAPLLGQPAGALAVQAVLFGCFAGFLPVLPATARGRAALGGELLLRIVLIGAAGYVGKDGVILLLLLIAVQLLRRTAHAPLGRGPAVALIVVATLFLLVKAPNFLTVVVAAALILPFFVLAPGRYALAICALVALGALAVPLNRTVDAQVFHARDLHPDKQLVLFDLAGISVRTGRNAFAAVAGWPAEQLQPPARCYVPYMWDSFAHWMPCGGYATAYDHFDGPLTRRWLAEIAQHPLAYLQHRLRYAGYLLVSTDHATWGIAGQAANDATDPAAMASLRQGIAEVGARQPIALWSPSVATPPLQWLERATLRYPKVQWVGLLACLSILLWNWLRRADGVRLGAILAAGLGAGNFAMLAVFGVADPARYLLPTVVLGYTALLAMLAPARRR